MMVKRLHSGPPMTDERSTAKGGRVHSMLKGPGARAVLGNSEIMIIGKKIALLGAVAALALGATEAGATATVVNVSATSSAGTTLSLGAGQYSFSFIGTAQGGAYSAASAWATTTGCDGAGRNCSQGWLTALFIDLGNTVGAFDRTTGLAYWPQPYLSPYFATPEAANAAAQTGTFIATTLAGTPSADTTAPFTFSLASAQDVNFFLKDSYYGDNRGGISIALARVGAAVPEPATWAMLLAGFGAVGFAMRRKREQRVAVSFG